MHLESRIYPLYFLKSMTLPGPLSPQVEKGGDLECFRFFVRVFMGVANAVPGHPDVKSGRGELGDKTLKMNYTQSPLPTACLLFFISGSFIF